MSLVIKNIIINACFIALSFFAYSQHELPLLPNCLEIELNNKSTIEDYISFSNEIKNEDPLKAVCLLIQAKKIATTRQEKTLIAQNAREFSARYSRYTEAIYFQSLAGHLWKELDSVKQYSISVRKIGGYYYRLSDVFNAVKYDNIALTVNQENNFKDQEYRTLYQLAWCNWRIGNCDVAISYIEKCKKLIESGLVSRSLKNYYNSISTFYSCKEMYDEAMKYIDLTIELSKEKNDKRLLGVSLSNKFKYQLDMGKININFDLINEALSINKQMNDIAQLGGNLGLLSKAYLLKGDYKKTIETGLKSIDYSRTAGARFKILLCYDYIKQSYFQLGDFSKAFNYSEKYKLLYEELYGSENIGKIFEIQQQQSERLNQSIITNLENEKKANALVNKQNRRIYWLTLIIVLLIFGGILNYYIKLKNNQKLKNKIIRERLSYDLLQMEMEALRSRMNPHFLFNSLNSIKSYITKNDSRNASNYLTKFATLVRMILNHSKEKVISLEDELKAINYYLEIEQMRLKDKFEFKINVDKSLNISDILVPPSIIQPFVENSIWHGFSKIERKGMLQLNVFSKDNTVIIEIEDNGIGRKEARLLRLKNSTHHSVGTNIIKKTIEVFNSENIINLDIKTIDLFTPEKKSKGTKVIIIVKKV